MKKIVYMAASLLMMIAVSSCSKEEVGGTATESMAGQWYVTVDAVDENGNPIDGGEDYFGIGARQFVYTYNTAANNASEIWLDDMGLCNVADMYGNAAYPNYAIKTKITCDQSNLTFKGTELENYADPAVLRAGIVEAMPVTIDGKILKGAGRQNNGSPADSIVIFVQYKDDPWYPDDGYAKYKISGIRYSGLAEND